MRNKYFNNIINDDKKESNHKLTNNDIRLNRDFSINSPLSNKNDFKKCLHLKHIQESSTTKESTKKDFY